MGIVRAIQKGDAPASKFSKAARDAAKDMSKSDVKKYAKTKHKGLPRKVKQELLDKLKKEYAFYHRGTFSRKRKHDDDNNLGRKKKHSGQPDLEERLYVPSKFDKALDRLKFNQFTPNNIKRLAKKFKVDYKDAVEFIKQNKVINVANKPTMAEGMVKPARGHEFFQLTKDVELDYISGHSGIGLKVPGVMLHNVVSQFKGKKGAYIINYFGRHAYVDMKKRQQMDILPIGNKYQKKLRWNSNYKTVDMAPDYSDWKNFKKPVKENVVKNHDGKAAPYGSGYEKVDEKFDKNVHLKLLNKALRAVPGSQKQKEIIRKLNVVRKAGGMRPLKETALSEVGIFPIQNYLSGMIPKGRLNVTNKQDKERVLALIKDLVFTLNSFWKSNKIPFRVREPRKSDMNRFKQKNKRF